MTGHMTGRGRKAKPGHITFVGSGPGDPNLLTTRARNVLANATCVFTDPDVPQAVLDVVGVDLPPAAGPVPQSVPVAGEDHAAAQVVSAGPDIRPALGEPAEVARTLVAEAKSGVDVVRLVAGDPLSVDAVSTEVMAVSKTALPFEIVPGLPATVAVPTYASLPLGSTHTVAHVRGEVD